MDDFDYDGCEIENIVQPEKKKRKNSKRKGKGGELALVQLLNERFKTQAFSRVVGSGNRWGQISYVTKDYIGDVVCPPNFRFMIECKCGYQEIDLYRTLVGQEKALDGFLAQATKDAGRVEPVKEPMLCWKKDRQPWIAFVRTKAIPKTPWSEPVLIYDGWLATSLERLLSLPDEVFLA